MSGALVVDGSEQLSPSCRACLRGSSSSSMWNWVRETRSSRSTARLIRISRFGLVKIHAGLGPPAVGQLRLSMSKSCCCHGQAPRFTRVPVPEPVSVNLITAIAAIAAIWALGVLSLALSLPQGFWPDDATTKNERNYRPEPKARVALHSTSPGSP